VLCEMLGLTWSYSSCGSCFGVRVVLSDWMIECIILGSSNGGGRLYNLFSIMRLRA